MQKQIKQLTPEEHQECYELGYLLTNKCISGLTEDHSLRIMKNVRRVLDVKYKQRYAICTAKRENALDGTWSVLAKWTRKF